MNNNFKFKVNLGGMIDILSNHLYSSPNVFVRELLQNCSDAISARIAKDASFSEKQAFIEIEVIKGEQIIFRDNGTGLNEEEIHKFLAVIGQSSKYDIKNSQSNGDYIGRFGIGLLSCFMVTDSICVRTCPYNAPDTVFQWKGMSDGTYTIDTVSEKMNVGTEIIIKNNKTNKDGDVVDNYFNSDVITNLVYYFALFLKYPIYIINNGKRIKLNLKFDFNANKDKEKCMQAGKILLGDDFMDCFQLESESGLFNGIAFVVAYPVSANIHNINRIYLKNMLITESGKNLIPEWAFFLRCIINTDNLKPTSSREDFYEDETLEKARNELSDCIANYLETLDYSNKDMLYNIVKTHNLAVKSIISANDSLDNILLPYITFETSLGEMSGKEISEFGGNAFYTCDINQFKQLSSLYIQRSSLLINAGYVYEKNIISKIAEKSRLTVIEKLTENDIDFMLGDSEFYNDEKAEKVRYFAEKVLYKYDCHVSLKAFEPFEIPTLYTIDEKANDARQIKRSMESANDVFMGMLASFEEDIPEKTFACLYLNTNNLVIRKMFEIQDTNKLQCYIEILYVQSLLSGHFPLLHNEMKIFTEKLYKLMTF